MTSASKPQRIERSDGNFLSDFFKLGVTSDVWMIDTLRVWGIPATGASCGNELGDSIQTLTLLGALDNPPIPGQPVCDCHALIPLATVSLSRGSSISGNPNVKLTRQNGAWQIDFRNVRWSVPGGSDVLFTVRATPRTGSSCRAGTRWSLAASDAPAGYRLHLLNKAGVPIGPADAAAKPLTVDVEVWATRTKQ